MQDSLKGVKLTSWNVNGIRSVTKSFGSLKRMLDSLNSDIVLLQETKLSKEGFSDLDICADGWVGFHSLCRKRDAYSGCSTFVREGCPVRVLAAEEGLCGNVLQEKPPCAGSKGTCGPYPNFQDVPSNSMVATKGCGEQFHLAGTRKNETGQNPPMTLKHHEIENPSLILENELEISTDALQSLDGEGRCVVIDIGIAVVFNLYFPMAVQQPVHDPSFETKSSTANVAAVSSNEPDAHPFSSRMHFKWAFNSLVEMRMRELVRAGRHVIVAGDWNVSPFPVDSARSDSSSKMSKTREWIQCLLQTGFTDTFRYHHGEDRNAYTCWDTRTEARKANYGSRIDLIVTDMVFAKSHTMDSAVHADVHGSDHCPVSMTMPPNLFEPSMHHITGRLYKTVCQCSPSCTETKRKARCSCSQATFTCCMPRECICTKMEQSTAASNAPMFNTDCNEGRCPSFVSTGIMGRSSKQSYITGFAKQQNGFQEIAKDRTGSPPKKRAKLVAKQSRLSDFFREPSRGKVGKDGDESPLIVASNSECANQASRALDEIGTSEGRLDSHWTNLFIKIPAPLCKHGEACIKKTSKTKTNKNRDFWMCGRAEGLSKDCRCKVFHWADDWIKKCKQKQAQHR